VIQENIVLSSLADIGAMKLSAATSRGSKKDFFDIFELLQHFSLSELLSSYHQKFINVDSYHVLRALIYFDDANGQPDPLMLKDYNWETIKSKLVRQIQDYMLDLSNIEKTEI
jgi:hypothetical protein